MSIKFTKTKGKNFDIFEGRGDKGDLQRYDIQTTKRLWTHMFVKGSLSNDRVSGEVIMTAGTWTEDYGIHELGLRTYTCLEDGTLFYCIHQKDRNADYSFISSKYSAGFTFKTTGPLDLFVGSGRVEVDGIEAAAPVMIENISNKVVVCLKECHTILIEQID